MVLDYAYGAASFVMPAVLGKLGAEVLSVNPYAAARESLTFDRWEHARGVSALVRAAGADFGAVLGPDGERITLIDDNGRALSDTEGLLALLSLVLRRGPCPWRTRPSRAKAGAFALPDQGDGRDGRYGRRCPGHPAGGEPRRGYEIPGHGGA